MGYIIFNSPPCGEELTVFFNGQSVHCISCNCVSSCFKAPCDCGIVIGLVVMIKKEMKSPSIMHTG